MDLDPATAAFVAVLGDWTAGPGPLHRKLERAIARLVERGELARGWRLPAERRLAKAIVVTRGVVVLAYDALVADGLVERRQGSGTYVAGSAGSGLPPGREGSRLIGHLVDRPGGEAASLVPPPLGAVESVEAGEVIDLSVSVLGDVAGLPPAQVDVRRLLGDGLDSPWGVPALRRRIAERTTAIGLDATPDQIVVTTGAQQGISIAVGCWVRPGDRVVIDDPTYPGALSALLAAGAVPVPVPVDRHGPRLAELEAALATRPAMAYVQSRVHSPTGGRLSAHRRKAIAELVVRHQVPLVEDHALFAVDWAGGDGPGALAHVPIAAHAPGHPIAVVGSYSKRFWAGLRVGFVRAPEVVAQRLVRVKATHDLGSSVPGQSLALALLDHPDHERWLRARNVELARRAALLAGLIESRLPGWTAAVPHGGLSLWVRLPAPVAGRFADVARRHGVVVATAEGLSARPQEHRDRLRLTFALPEPALLAAVDRLASAWSTFARLL
ncbi:MAG: PLP-dependent aminotransferase family protein [Acidimicrobiales bacterium]